MQLGSKPEKEVEAALARRSSYRMSFSYSSVFSTQARPLETITDEMVAKQLKSDLLNFLSQTNNSWLKEVVASPQNRLQVVLDFFPKLHEAARSATLKLPIPDTLCLHDNSSLHIYSESSNDTVRFREGAAAVNSFVQHLEAQIEDLPASAVSEFNPRAIVLDEVGGHKVCLSVDEVPKRWLEARSRFKMIQQYVVPKSKEIVKYRIVWVKDRQPLMYIITRLGAHAVTTKQSDSRRYLHDINTFSYAGRLLRSSFSPFFPYSSNLQESLLEKQSAIPRQTSKKSLILRTRPKSKFSLVKVQKRIPQLEGMASILCDILRSKVLHSQEDIRLLIFDVSQGQDSVYRLMNVKGVLCSRKPDGELLSELPVGGGRNQTAGMKQYGNRTGSKSREWLEVFQREKSAPAPRKRCPYVDLKEANERKVSIYPRLPRLELEDSEPPPPPKSRLRVYCSDLIAQTAQLYDSMRTNSSAKREDLQKHDIAFLAYPHFVDNLIDKFHHRLSESSLSFYFKGKDTGAMKSGLIKAISSLEGYTFRFRLRKVHQTLSISGKEFESYLATFAQQLKEDGVPEVDVACAVARLAQYQGDIVEPDSPGPLRSLKKQ